MDDLNSMISSLLENPESLEMIKNLAEQFKGKESESSNSSTEAKQTVSQSPLSDLGGLGDIASLFGSLKPDTLSSVSGIVKNYNSVDVNKINLLNSLKPYMSEKRKSNVGNAILMMRILKVAESLGIDLSFFKKK